MRRQLLGVKGIAEVSSFGGKLKQYEVTLQPQKLAAHGLTMDEVYTTVERKQSKIQVVPTLSRILRYFLSTVKACSKTLVR